MHPAYGAQIIDDLAYVERLGRALGIIIVLATQRPDNDALPPKIRDLATVRFCLKVPDQVSNDMILGTGAYQAGYRASEFRPKIDAGLGWFKGEGDPQAVRTHYLDLNDTARIAARARAMREAAGVLSGYALGETARRRGAQLRRRRADRLRRGPTRCGARRSPPGCASTCPQSTPTSPQEAVASQLRALGVAVRNVREPGREPRAGLRADRRRGRRGRPGDRRCVALPPAARCGPATRRRPAQTRHGRYSARRPERAGLPGSGVPARRRGHAAARRLAARPPRGTPPGNRTPGGDPVSAASDRHDYRECFYDSQPDRGRAPRNARGSPAGSTARATQLGYQRGYGGRPRRRVRRGIRRRAGVVPRPARRRVTGHDSPPAMPPSTAPTRSPSSWPCWPPPVCYAVSLFACPTRRCRTCGGTGARLTRAGRRYRGGLCRRCRGTGRIRRIGATAVHRFYWSAARRPDARTPPRRAARPASTPTTTPARNPPIGGTMP